MALTATDAYKLSHKGFMEPNTEIIYSNFTPRSDKYLPVLKDRSICGPKHKFHVHQR